MGAHDLGWMLPTHRRRPVRSQVLTGRLASFRFKPTTTSVPGSPENWCQIFPNPQGLMSRPCQRPQSADR